LPGQSERLRITSRVLNPGVRSRTPATGELNIRLFYGCILRSVCSPPRFAVEESPPHRHRTLVRRCRRNRGRSHVLVKCGSEDLPHWSDYSSRSANIEISTQRNLAAANRKSRRLTSFRPCQLSACTCDATSRARPQRQSLS